jgi:hypothetical protein
VGPTHRSFVSNLAGPARIAKNIIEALVQDLKFRPGDFVYEKPLSIAFGLTAENISGGLEHAQLQGWPIFDPVQRIYTLTRAGFEVA